jgi:hypothetical protein
LARRKALRAYVFLQTRLGASNDVVENLRKGHEKSFRRGSSVYGWYDAVVEFEIPDMRELSQIVDDLKHNCLDIIHIGTAVERTDDSSSPLVLGRSC